MTTEPITWSEEKLKQLQEQLAGTWAEEDTWLMRSKKHKNRPVYEYPFHFNEFPSASLAIEFKYALWMEVESGYRKSDTDQGNLYRQLKHVRNWLNHVAPSTRSLLERDVEAWVWSLRTYLVEHGLYHTDHSKRLTARQEYVMDTTDDRRIGFFRALYRIVILAQGSTKSGRRSANTFRSKSRIVAGKRGVP